MGVDCTLYIITEYSDFPPRPNRPDDPWIFASAMVALDRDSALWNEMRYLPVVGNVRRIQVMLGSYVRYFDGTKPIDQRDRELGFHFGDLYEPDAGFKVHRVADLVALAEGLEPGTWNRSALEAVGALYRDHYVILFWT